MEIYKLYSACFLEKKDFYIEVDREARLTIADHANSTHTGCLSHSNKGTGLPVNRAGSTILSRTRRGVNFRYIRVQSVYIGAKSRVERVAVEKKKRKNIVKNISLFKESFYEFLEFTKSKFAQLTRKREREK